MVQQATGYDLQAETSFFFKTTQLPFISPFQKENVCEHYLSIFQYLVQANVSFHSN